MRDANFEWDDKKSASNLLKHWISFEAARLVFDDINAFDKEDPDPDEERFTRVGLVNGRLVAVTYTERGERIRIISARKAAPNEEAEYFGRI